MIVTKNFVVERPCVAVKQSNDCSDTAQQVKEPIDMEGLCKNCRPGDNTLETLLSQAFPQHCHESGVNESFSYLGEPMYDVSFPVMHSYNLQLSNVIASNLCKNVETRSENGHHLRPSTRLLAKIG